MHRFLRLALALICGTSFSFAMVPSSKVFAVNPAVWNVSESTTGNDVFWTSPTAVDLGFPRYLTSFEITRVEAFTIFGGTDVTDDIDFSSGTGFVDSLPVTLVDESLSEPTTGTAATVNVGIDANGFGQASITDVTLGTLVILPITQIDVDATVAVQGIVPGDFDGNLKVDSLDLLAWESAFGSSGGADTDGDGDSDGFDFLDWQQFFGSDFSSPAFAATVAPEPSSIAIFSLGMVLLLTTRNAKRKRRM